MDRMKEKLTEVLAEHQIRQNEPMNSHTTFRVGGPADWFVEPEDARQLAAVISCCRDCGQPYYILGNGSNLLVGDLGYRGVIISMGRAWSAVTADPEEKKQIRAGAGALLSSVARYALGRSLAGLEFAAGIPGTVGGAVVMNAGAYGSDLCQVLASAKILTRDGQVKEIPAKELELDYRTSCIPREGYVVLEAAMQLEPGDPDGIRERMDTLAIQRKSRQPLEYPSAGSTFKRPEGYFAGKLIQDAGLRGVQLGGAQVSEKHCGFVINRGGATAADILGLCRRVQEEVQRQFGVSLEMEVKLLGEFG